MPAPLPGTGMAFQARSWSSELHSTMHALAPWEGDSQGRWMAWGSSSGEWGPQPLRRQASSELRYSVAQVALALR